MSQRGLVVDDDEAIRLVLSALLGDEGYGVRVAAGGREGLEILNDWRPDAVVLDVVMPGVDATVFRAVQVATPEVADIPVLLTSATRSADLARIAAELGVAAAIPKPFDAEEFLAALRAVLT